MGQDLPLPIKAVQQIFSPHPLPHHFHGDLLLIEPVSAARQENLRHAALADLSDQFEGADAAAANLVVGGFSQRLEQLFADSGATLKPG